MLDVSVAYNRYRFLGYEFLTWLWFVIDKDQQTITDCVKEAESLHIGNRIVLENRQNNSLESITIKGDDAGLEEGVLALKKGAVVTEMNLAYSEGDQQWRFTLKGESLGLSGLKTPETGNVETREDLEGAVLEKVYLYDKAVALVDALFKKFIHLRLSEDWNTSSVVNIRKWLHA